jgi:AmiR/NasT family two-component response regulator
MSTPPRVLLACSDLFFSTQLRGVAQAAGAAVDVELSAARIAERAVGGGYSLVVTDLEMTGLDLPAVIAGLSTDSRPTVLAFGPHVQAARLKAAREAGCEHVVPRSMAAETVAQILGDLKRIG